MFSRRVFGGSADSFKLLLEYGSPGVESPQELRFLNALDFPLLGGSSSASSSQAVRLPVVAVSMEFEFNSDESEATIVERFVAKKAALLLDRIEERVQVKIVIASASSAATTIWANSAHPPGAEAGVSLQLSIACRQPVLRCVQFYRLSSSGSPSDAVMLSMLSHCDLSTVWKLKSAEGFGNWWASAAKPSEWLNLRNMNLSHCGLSVLPPSIGEVKALRILRLSHNKLTLLPAELQTLSNLEVLAVDHNLLTAIPAELRHCSALRELNLEGNKLTTPVLDLRSLYNLQSLQLFGNPLEYLPELSPCTQLRSLSLANVRIMADALFSRWEVEVGALSYMARAHKLSPLFKLTFRRSSLQHPLLAGALGRIAEDRSNCELIAKEEAAIQQLVLMAMSENALVVKQACKTIGHLAEYSPATAKQLIEHDVLSAVVTLMRAPDQDSQLCGLNVLSSLGTGSDTVSAQLLSPSILQRLHHLIKHGDPSVRQAALFSLSNLCFCRDNKVMVRKAEGLLQMLVELAQPHAALGTSDLSRLMAVRVLAVLGENEQVRLALGQPPIQRRGLRILCMDGGGMRGLVTVQMLRHLEQRLGRPVGSAFDLVVGTSTGAILAVSLGMLRYNLEQCENIYTSLGHKVFNNQAAAARESEMATWSESLYRMYKNGSQNIRAATAVVFASCKHDATTFEVLLKDMCNLVKMNCVSDQFIDATVLGGPKVLVVATLASTSPAVPYVFRSYELPLEAERRAAKIGGWAGSSKHLVWQAVRASSAAPYYLDEFSIGDERFQDGAAIANNPTLVAIQQAQLLWPDLPIDVVVSLGSGLPQTKPRERGLHAYLDTGTLLIESATSTERVHEAAATLLNLVPGVKYFRFQPVDDRCTIELDDIDPAHWAQLKVSTEEFCIAHAARFDEAAAALLSPEHGPKESSCLRTGPAQDLASPRIPALRLGARRGLLLLEAPRCPPHLPGSSLTEKLAEAVAQLPALTRRVDVGAAAGRLHDSQLSLGAAAGPGGAADAAGPPPPFPLTGFGSFTPGPAPPDARGAGSSGGSLPAHPSEPHPPVPVVLLQRIPSTQAPRTQSMELPDPQGGAGSRVTPLTIPLGGQQPPPGQGPRLGQGLSSKSEPAPSTSPTAPAATTFLNYFIPTSWTSATATAAAAAVAPSAALSPRSSSPGSGPSPPAGRSASQRRGSEAAPAPAPAPPQAGGSAPAAAARPRSSEPGGRPAAPSEEYEQRPATARAGDGSGAAQPRSSIPPSAYQGQRQPEGAAPAAQPGSGAAGGSAACLPPHHLIRALLQDLGEGLGVVHLALHAACPPPSPSCVAGAGAGGGLVLQWKQEVLAVLEPGPDATGLVHELGHDPSHTSLAQLFAQTPEQSCFQLGDALLMRLAQQQVTTATGSQVSSFLFQRTSPLQLLLPEHVLAMVSDWSGLLVASATPLSRALVEALLRSGVKALVAPDPEAWAAAVRGRRRRAGEPGAPAAEPEGEPRVLVRATSSVRMGDSVSVPGALEDGVQSFFGSFYKALFGGETVLSAIQAGESSAPNLEAMFVCFHL